MSQGGIDLHGLKGGNSALFIGLDAEGAHVMKAVT